MLIIKILVVSQTSSLKRANYESPQTINYISLKHLGVRMKRKLNPDKEWPFG